MGLEAKRCQACNAETPRLDDAQIRRMLGEVGGWAVEDGKLVRHCTFKDFGQAVGFIVRMALVADREDHHPDFALHGWNKLDVTLYTHAIGGLSENDFILAAKINQL